MRAFAKVLLILLGLLAFAYLMYCAQVWSAQRKMMFPGANMAVSPQRGDWPDSAQSLDLRGADGTSARVIWLPAQAGGVNSTLVFFHGNAEFAFQSVAALAKLAGPGRNLMLIEYPGYAGAAGKPGLDSIRAVSLVGYDWLLVQPGVDPQRIIAIGRSIGGGPAAELSRHRPLAGLVLISSFAAIADFASALHVPRLLIRDPFDNRAALRKYQGPVLLLHGRYDDVIPYAHGVDLASTAPSAELVTLSCAHNDCALDGDEIHKAIEAFLARHGF